MSEDQEPAITKSKPLFLHPNNGMVLRSKYSAVLQCACGALPKASFMYDRPEAPLSYLNETIDYPSRYCYNNWQHSTRNSFVGKDWDLEVIDTEAWEVHFTYANPDKGPGFGTIKHPINLTAIPNWSSNLYYANHWMCSNAYGKNDSYILHVSASEDCEDNTIYIKDGLTQWGTPMNYPASPTSDYNLVNVFWNNGIKLVGDGKNNFRGSNHYSDIPSEYYVNFTCNLNNFNEVRGIFIDSNISADKIDGEFYRCTINAREVVGVCYKCVINADTVNARCIDCIIKANSVGGDSYKCDIVCQKFSGYCIKSTVITTDCTSGFIDDSIVKVTGRCAVGSGTYIIRNSTIEGKFEPSKDDWDYDRIIGTVVLINAVVDHTISKPIRVYMVDSEMPPPSDLKSVAGRIEVPTGTSYTLTDIADPPDAVFVNASINMAVSVKAGYHGWYPGEVYELHDFEDCTITGYFNIIDALDTSEKVLAGLADEGCGNNIDIDIMVDIAVKYGGVEFTLGDLRDGGKGNANITIITRCLGDEEWNCGYSTNQIAVSFVRASGAWSYTSSYSFVSCLCAYDENGIVREEDYITKPCANSGYCVGPGNFPDWGNGPCCCEYSNQPCNQEEKAKCNCGYLRWNLGL